MPNDFFRTISRFCRRTTTARKRRISSSFSAAVCGVPVSAPGRGANSRRHS
jgi:hypothetical protein